MADESAMNFGGVGAFISIFLLFTQYFYELGANFDEIANNVEQDEERDAVVRDIREKFSA